MPIDDFSICSSGGENKQGLAGMRCILCDLFVGFSSMCVCVAVVWGGGVVLVQLDPAGSSATERTLILLSVGTFVSVLGN